MRYTREKLTRKLNSYFQRWIGPLPIYPYCYTAKWRSLFVRSSLNASSESNPLQYFAARPNPGAGIGHQMANWIAGFYYAQHFNLNFAHIPFPDRAWENLLGFGSGEVKMDALMQNQGYRKVRIPLFKSPDEVTPLIRSYAGKKIVFLAERDQFLREQHHVIDSIQKKFHQANPSPKLNYSPDTLNIAIHVRRGDIMDGDNAADGMAQRFQSIDYFENVLRPVLAATEGRNPRIYLFSQEKRETFQALEALHPIEFCLDMGAQESFLHMAMANILITSKSSFSYKPALLSKGIKICPKDFWHTYPDALDWVLAEANGNFKEEQLLKLLNQPMLTESEELGNSSK